MITTNLSYYDKSKYEPIGMVSATAVDAVSAVRGMISGLTSLFGGQQTLIETKFADIRKRCLEKLKLEAAIHRDVVMMVGVDFDVSEMIQFVVCVGTATLLVRKNNQNEPKLANDALNQQKINHVQKMTGGKGSPKNKITSLDNFPTTLEELDKSKHLNKSKPLS